MGEEEDQGGGTGGGRGGASKVHHIAKNGLEPRRNGWKEAESRVTSRASRDHRASLDKPRDYEGRSGGESELLREKVIRDQVGRTTSAYQKDPRNAPRY
eukprot:4165739-Pyramimonas_sp.AAC.1